MKFLHVFGLALALAAPLASAHFLTDEEIRAQFTPSDLNKDGSVSFKELETATRKQLKQFEDPYISKEEMTKFVHEIVNSIMVSDTDKDGLLSFEEFANMMRTEHANNMQRQQRHEQKMAQQAAEQEAAEQEAAEQEAAEQEAAEQQNTASSEEQTETGDVVLVEDEQEAEQPGEVKNAEL